MTIDAMLTKYRSAAAAVELIEAVKLSTETGASVDIPLEASSLRSPSEMAR